MSREPAVRRRTVLCIALFIAAGGCAHQPSASTTATNDQFADAVELHRRGELSLAIERYRQIIASQSDHYAARFNLGVAELQRGHAADAVTLFDQILGEHANDLAARFALTLALTRAGRRDDALEQLDELEVRYDAALSKVVLRHGTPKPEHLGRRVAALDLPKRVSQLRHGLEHRESVATKVKVEGRSVDGLLIVHNTTLGQ